VSYADKQRQLREEEEEGSESAGGGRGAGHADPCYEDFNMFSGFIQEALDATVTPSVAEYEASSHDDAAKRTGRRLVAELLETLTLGIDTDSGSNAGKGHAMSPSAGCAAEFAKEVLGNLPRLGVATMEDAFGMEGTGGWEQQWGFTPGGEPGSSSSDEDEGIDASGARAAVLYWLLILPEEWLPFSRGMPPKDLVQAAHSSYLALMQRAADERSVPVALKALSIASKIAKAVKQSPAPHEGSLCGGSAPEVPHLLLLSVVGVMAHHPVSALRLAAHTALKRLLSAVPRGAPRLMVYGRLLGEATPAGAAIVLQQLQHDVTEGSDAALREGSLGLVREWVEPRGRHGWGDGLEAVVEPLCAALSILRFLLLASRCEGAAELAASSLPALLRECASAEACGDATEEGAASDSDAASALSRLMGLRRLHELTQWALEAAEEAPRSR